jgi:hypothetical protein
MMGISRAARRPRVRVMLAVVVAAALFAAYMAAEPAGGSEPTSTDSAEALGIELLENAPMSPYADGRLPAEEPWLSDQASLRAAHGLPTDRELIASLMVSSEAQRQVGVYGYVMTALEEERAAVRRSRQMEKTRVLEAVVQDVGYAGAIFDVDTGVLELLWKADQRNRPEVPAVVDVDVRVIGVRFSLTDLRSMSEDATANLRGRSDAGRSEVADSVRRTFDADEIDAIGYSMRDNGLTVHLRDGIRTNGRTVGGQVPIVVVESTVSEDHIAGPQGAAPCGDWWCGAPRGGHYVRFSSNGSGFVCTASPAVRVWIGSWRYYHLTAGHCGTTSEDEPFYMGGRYDGSLASVAAHFGIAPSLGVGSSFLGNEWRNTTERAGNARGDFMLFGTGTGSSGQSNHTTNNQLMTTGTTSVRSAGPVPLAVNDDICISAPLTRAKCDKIDNLGWVKTIDGKEIRDLAAVRGGYDAQGGDSGAPIYLKDHPQIFVGVHSGSKVNTFGQRFQLFSQASLIGSSTNNLGVSNVSVVSADGKRDYVQNMYFRNLNRVPDVGGFNYWYGVLAPCNTATASTVAAGVLGSTEFRTRVPVTSLNRAQIRVEYAYRTYFGRTADAGGMAYWSNSLWNASDKEAQWNAILAGFANSTEFHNRVNGIGTSTDGAICA